MANVIAIKSFYYEGKRIVRGSTLYPSDEEALRLEAEGKVRIVEREVAKKKENEPVICSGLKHAVSQAAPASPKKIAKKSGAGEKQKKTDESL